jgi:HNH endonuclease
MAWKLTDNFKGRFNRIGHPGKKGADHPCWKGGRTVDTDGYIRVWAPDHPWPRKGYMLEHVRTIELQIGRRISRNECVHHRDGNRQNNDLANLDLMTRSAHSKLHRAKDVRTFKRSQDGRFTCGCT